MNIEITTGSGALAFFLFWLVVLVSITFVVAIIFFSKRRSREERAIQSLLATFGSAKASVSNDPTQLLVWEPLAKASRGLFPKAFLALDKAVGYRFPFSKEFLEEAHDRWTGEWLAWEVSHDEEYRFKEDLLNQELKLVSGDEAERLKVRLSHLQNEKLQRYQARYEEYIRTAKALQALIQ